MNSYITEQDDADEMSGYNKARRQAAIRHREANRGSWWKTLLAIIITALLAWWMSGCTTTETNIRDHKRLKYDELSDVVTIITVDDCEYVVFHGYKKGGIVHKANCSNPIHK